jgi:Cof subfamily protein (haloacid dehalogenase superfamily)
MYKIVFFDIDGTLLNSQRELPKSAIEAIHELHEKGIITVIASARPPFNIQHLLHELNISSYIVYNGGLVVKDGEVIHRNVIDNKLLLSIQETVVKRNDSVIMDCEDGFIVIGEDQEYIKKRYLERSWNVAKDKGSVDYLSEASSVDVFQLELVCTKEEDKGGKGDTAGKFKYLVDANEEVSTGTSIAGYVQSYPDLTFYPWISYKNVYNAVPKQVSKAYGIQKLLQYLEIDPSESVAFGDGLNDIEMLSFVGMGVAMGNAADKLKKVSNYVTKHVDDDGIQYGLKHLGLI